MKYRDYFRISKDYRPCIDESMIKANPDLWLDYYPHDTFIKILAEMAKSLSRADSRPAWIDGTYGTGKSHAVFALKGILDCSQEKLQAYFDEYRDKQPKLTEELLFKLQQIKKGKIITVYRYSSGSISNNRDLIFAIQESVKAALKSAKLDYFGENTLREGVCEWLKNAENQSYFDLLLKTPEFRSQFGGMTAEDVIKRLESHSDVTELVRKIFDLADKKRIFALELTTRSLKEWLSDVITKNNLSALVFFWDEFSEYFEKSTNSLTDFQDIVSLSQDKPFYFCPITHKGGRSVFERQVGGKKLYDRFLTFAPMELSMPDSIAFDLLRAALKIDPAAESDWRQKSEALNTRVYEAREAVQKNSNIKAETMKDIVPLHPMAALLLKNIATSFESNQRSMFDFLKNAYAEESKSFQWFIDNYGPVEDDEPLLALDMLWDFFYTSGRDKLSVDIRAILDTYPRYEKTLSSEEKRVLKAILMMYAISQFTRDGLELLMTTDRNIRLAFNGTALEDSAVRIAKKLVQTNEILYLRPIDSKGNHIFAPATISADQAVIDKSKRRLREEKKTSALISDFNDDLSRILSLTPALRTRYDIILSTIVDFPKRINELREKQSSYKIFAIMCLAKDDTEAAKFRELIKKAAADVSYEKLVFIDGTAQNLTDDEFDNYCEYLANAEYQNGKDNTLRDDYTKKAKGILKDWQNKIYNGQVALYSHSIPYGNSAINGAAFQSILLSSVYKRYPKCFDGAHVSETMFSVTGMKAGAECGITKSTKGAFGGVEKSTLANVWSDPQYYSTLPHEPISEIKNAVETKVQKAFKDDGRISITEIIDFLVNDYGFMPCNLYAFITGFILREYAGQPYRYSDGEINEPMSPEYMKSIIEEYYKQYTSFNMRYKTKYIASMSIEEAEFINLASKVFKIPANNCVSVEITVRLIRAELKNYLYPIWVLNEIDTAGLDDYINKFLELVNDSNGKEATSKTAMQLGKMIRVDSNAIAKLQTLVTKENCRQGMLEFAKRFESGELIRIANEIGAGSEMLSHIREKFEVREALWLWDKDTAIAELKNLIVEYNIVSASNALISSSNNYRKCIAEWLNQIKFFKIAYEALKSTKNDITGVLPYLYKIASLGELTTEERRLFAKALILEEVKTKQFIKNQTAIIKEVAAIYFEGLDDNEIAEVCAELPSGMFVSEKSAFLKNISLAVEQYKKGQAKTKLRNLWKDKTNSKTPFEWSSSNKTPILCLMPKSEYENAKRAFEAINRNNPDDKEIEFAIDYISKTVFLDDLSNVEKRDKAFLNIVVGSYKSILADVGDVRDYLHGKVSIEPYDWYPNPSVSSIIAAYAKSKYDAGGCDKAIEKIDRMKDDELKKYLKRLVKDNIIVGIEIIEDEV